MTSTLLPRAAALAAPVLLWLAAPALGAPASGEQTPLDLGAADPASASGGGGPSLVRTIVGLAVVIGVIYGVAWVLRQVKAGRQERAMGAGGIASVASVPLGSGRALHLVRAGSDLILLGVADHGVTPIRTYTAEEARAAGLLDDDGDLTDAAAAAAAKPAASTPRGAAAAAATGGRSLVTALQRWTVRG